MLRVLTFLSVVMLFFGCIKEQQKVSWLKIEKWDLVANPLAQNDQGELTHNFNQVFLNMNGKVLGAFELPAKVPILAEGKQNFVLLPGIANNGISSTKKRYPFVEPYSVEFELVLEDTVTMYPVTRYYDNIQFLIEDFENPAPKLIADENSVAQIVRGSDSEYLEWGNFFGRIDLNDQDSIFFGYTNFGYNLPKQNREVYMELDFMNTNTIATSVISFSATSFYDDIHMQLMPREEEEWRHIYLDLREIVSFRNQATVNEQGFMAILDEKGTEKFVFLDNIKIVYR